MHVFGSEWVQALSGPWMDTGQWTLTNDVAVPRVPQGRQEGHKHGLGRLGVLGVLEGGVCVCVCVVDRPHGRYARRANTLDQLG